MKFARFVFLSGINWAWNIPHYPGHLHPGMPAVSINSEFYLFLLHNHYYLNSIHEGYHLPLAEYELPQKVIDMMKVNNEKGLGVKAGAVIAALIAAFIGVIGKGVASGS